MPNHRHVDLAIPDDDIDSFSRLSPNPPQPHTQLQGVAPRLPVDRGEGGWG